MEKFNFESVLNHMFDIPDKYLNTENTKRMVYWKLEKLNEIRDLFYNTDLSLLKDFSVVNNVHSEDATGYYIVHKDYFEILEDTDDFDLCFTIEEYIKARETKVITKIYPDLEITLKKTNWHIVTHDGLAIALMSKKDTFRFLCEDEYRYECFKVDSIEEGLEYLKMFKI